MLNPTVPPHNYLKNNTNKESNGQTDNAQHNTPNNEE